MTTRTTCLRLFFAQKMTQRQKMTLWLISGLSLSVTLFMALRSSLSERLDGAEAAVSLRPDPSPKETAGDPSFSGMPVTVDRLDRLQPASMVQRFSGIIKARRSSRLASKHLGRVTKIHVDLGDCVEAGQELAVLDSSELMAERDALEAQLSSAEARLRELRSGPRIQEIEQAEALVKELEIVEGLRQSNLHRSQGLVASSSVSQQELDENTSSLEALRAQLVSARKNLELLREGTRPEQIDAQEAVARSLKSQIEKVSVMIAEHLVTAPFSGHVQTRYVHEGVMVSPGQPIVEIVESQHLEVHVGLPTQLLASSSIDSAQVLCGQQPISATLSRVSPTVDQRTRNLEVVFDLPPQELVPFPSPSAMLGEDSANCIRNVRIGEAVDVQIAVPVDGSGWWVPSSALVPAARGLWSVMVAKPIDDNRFAATPRQVELLRSSGEWCQIQGPLDGQDLLIFEGLHRLTAGQIVSCMPIEENAQTLSSEPTPES